MAKFETSTREASRVAYIKALKSDVDFDRLFNSLEVYFYFYCSFL